MGPKGSRGEKVQTCFCYFFTVTERMTLLFLSRVRKEALAQEEWKALMGNRSDTLPLYCDTVRVDLSWNAFWYLKSRTCTCPVYMLLELTVLTLTTRITIHIDFAVVEESVPHVLIYYIMYSILVCLYIGCCWPHRPSWTSWSKGREGTSS